MRLTERGQVCVGVARRKKLHQWSSVTGDNAFGYTFLGAQGVGGSQKSVLLHTVRTFSEYLRYLYFLAYLPPHEDTSCRWRRWRYVSAPSSRYMAPLAVWKVTVMFYEATGT